MNRTYPASVSPGALKVVTSKVLRWLLLGSFVLSWPATVAAAGAEGVDAVLLIDSSGSMAKNDPDKLRVPAAKMFMSLLGDSDRIGLISFSDNGYPVLHLTAPDPENNARILAAADKVSSKGVYTNLYAATDKGLNMLAKEGMKDREPMLVLMSDGKMDVGNTDEDWTLTQKLQKDLVARAKMRGVKIYTIAFTEASDVDLMRDIAIDTGGLFKLARNDQDLHEVFSAIFESAKDPDMLPIAGGEFVVDSSIEEVTIVASKEREDVRIHLQTPEGTRLNSDNANNKLKWFLSQHFDMITIKDPEPGTWKLLGAGGDRNRAYVVTNMSLNHGPQTSAIKAHEEMVLETWMEQSGELMNREAVLTNTKFSMDIKVPSGETAHFDLKDHGREGDRTAADGKYSTVLAYENPGSYQINLLAVSETFSRQKTVHFEVEAPPAGLKAPPPSPSPEPVAEKPMPEPVAEPKPEPEPVPAAEPAPDPEPAVAEAVEAPEKKKMGLGFAIGIFAGINVLLAVIGGGVWWFLKRRKKGAEEASEGDDDDAEEEDGK